MKGIPFIYNGTEVAFPTAITFPFTTVTIDWSINPSVTTEYTKLIGFRNNSTAIRRGSLLSYDNSAQPLTTSYPLPAYGYRILRK